MSETVLASVLLKRGDAFAHLTLRSNGGRLTVEEVESRIDGNKRHGVVRVLWAGTDRAAADAEFESRLADRQADGFTARR